MHNEKAKKKSGMAEDNKQKQLPSNPLKIERPHEQNKR